MKRLGVLIVLATRLMIPNGCAATNALAGRDPNPWTSFGTVTDTEGKPVSGAKVRASCGMGTLLATGQALSGPDGAYELKFGPGWLSQDRKTVQAATISIHLSGWYETNLYRQGDLIAALDLPTESLRWATKTTNDLFLEGVPRRLDFVLAPAASIRGSMSDGSGQPLANKRAGLTGHVLPPSSSVLAEVHTDAKGNFEFSDVPVGYEFRLYVDDGRSDWRHWPFYNLKLTKPGKFTYHLKVQRNFLVD